MDRDTGHSSGEIAMSWENIIKRFNSRDINELDVKGQKIMNMNMDENMEKEAIEWLNSYRSLVERGEGNLVPRLLSELREKITRRHNHSKEARRIRSGNPQY